MAQEEIVIGGYRRTGILQTGQNSEIWEVVEVGGKQRYAMKLLLQDRTVDRAQRAAMKHEANIGLKLQHPNIIRFYKFSNNGRNPFIIMEFFRSTNLKLQIMRQETDQWKPRFRKVLTQFFKALSYFHSKGWVHRDVKPDNVLVNGSGEVRLIDFAISVRSASVLDRMLKRKRQPAGTRSYMAPEQILGIPLDARTDIYSTGIMLFELLTGRLPFTANSGNELLKKHLRTQPPLIPRETGATPEFIDLVRRMMAKEPKDRPQSVEDLLKEIRPIKILADEDVSLDSAGHGGGM